MQAVIFTGPQRVEVGGTAEPICGEEQVVLRVVRAGLCGTDLHIFRNEYLSSFPLIPGHEFCGVVAQVGGKVKDLKVGDRVAADPNLYCNACDFCRLQMNNHCLNWQGVGITLPGALAEYLAVPARACYRLPAGISDAQAAMVEPVSCVVHALTRLRVLPGDDALIFGAGPMGLIMAQALRHSGAGRVVVVDTQKERLKLAEELGVSVALAAGGAAEGKIKEMAPRGFAVVVDATGVPAVIEKAFSYLRPRGQYLQFGVTPRDATVALRPFDVFHYDWTILGSFALCYTFDRAIAWLAEGVIKVDKLVSVVGGLGEFPRLLEEFAQGRTLKVQFTP
ncbi:MAG: zinc-dependent alcohol dehydrogenase family protein [Phycisphaeraceae bacterium]|nr:zinc-dependent alcohol dehydrogenase family protein [Phycisphaeraceae bacterium]